LNWSCDEIADGALIERYLASQLSDAEAKELELHCLACDHCATQLRLGLAIRKALSRLVETDGRPPLELVTAVDQPAPSVEARGSTLAEHRARRWLGGRKAAALVAAAALAGLLLVWPSQLGEERDRTHREEGTAEETRPVLDTPVGDVADLQEFRWSPVASADLYRITIYDSSGEVLWETETEDTGLVPPKMTEFRRGSRYYWKVAARVGWDRWVDSELLQFSVTGP
jgi:hypothetical protein